MLMARSSVVRAVVLYAIGRGFDSHRAHHFSEDWTTKLRGKFFLPHPQRTRDHHELRSDNEI